MAQTQRVDQGWEYTGLTLILLLIALALTPATAAARPGNLDPFFGEGGKLVKAVDLEPESWRSAPAALAKLPHGVTVAAAGETLLAIKPNGRLATSFGGGRLEVPAPTLSSLRLVDVATAPGNRIVVAGTVVSDFASSASDPRGERLFLARYRADGTLDPSFGFGGTLVTDAGQPPPGVVEKIESKGWEAPRLKLSGIAVDAAGRIILSGYRLELFGPCRGGFSRFTEAFVARLAENGALDPAFGEGGVTLLSRAQEVEPPVLTEGGGVYLSAVLKIACAPVPETRLLIRLGSNGRPVSSFAQEGELLLPEVIYPEPTSLALDHMGRLLLLRVEQLEPRGAEVPETGRYVALVRRFSPSGRLDPSFGDGGAALLDPGQTHFDAGSIAVDAKGRILVAGTSSPPGYETSPHLFLLGRLEENGRLDRRFGRGGIVGTRFGAQSEARATSMVILRHQRVLVAGTLAGPSVGGGEGVAIARYTSR